MRVAVTGGTGHLGTNFVRHLLSLPAGEQPEEVRLVLRRDPTPTDLERLGVSSDASVDAVILPAAGSVPVAGDASSAGSAVAGGVAGDAVDAQRRAEAPKLSFARAPLDDASALARAFSGCDVVYHTAGRVSFGARDENGELVGINVDGTVNVVAACVASRVGRLVHVGSIEAFPLSEPPYPITEARSIDPARTVLAYGKSKAQAILEILGTVERGRLDAVVVCPTGFVGPGDYRLSPMGRMIADFSHGRLPAYVRGGFDFVDVRDVASGMLLAARHGRRGECYILSGEYVSVPRMMDLLAAATGVRKPFLCMPVAPILPFLPIVESYYRRKKLSPRFTRDSLALLSLGVTVSSEKARRELGYAPRPIEATLRDTVKWLRTVPPSDSD